MPVPPLATAKGVVVSVNPAALNAPVADKVVNAPVPGVVAPMLILLKEETVPPNNAAVVPNVIELLDKPIVITGALVGLATEHVTTPVGLQATLLTPPPPPPLPTSV